MKDRFLLSSVASALALLVCAPQSRAATMIGEYLTFSGFGTLGAVQTDSNEGTYGRDRQPGGADKTANFEVDSNLGLQMTATATPWLSATAQMLAAKRASADHAKAEMEWAFITIKPLDDLTVRAGRMAAPVFAISDSRNVGYANTWLRAPNEVYALNSFSRIDAVDASYRKPLGPVSIAATAFAGSTKVTSGGVTANCDELKGANVLFETDWATFRLGYMTTLASIPARNVSNDRYEFSGAAVTVDRDDIILQAEYVKRKSSQKPTVVNADGWYVMGGYRFGAFTPYAIIAKTAPETPTSPALLSAKQQSKALGLRWDVASQASVKFQFDHVDTQGTKGISFTTPATPPVAPGLPPGNKPVTSAVNVFSVAVDFVF
jgi:Gram-negative porin